MDPFAGGVWCGNCNRCFATLHYFSQHIFAKSNISCFQYFNKNSSSTKEESIGERALKWRKLRQRQEAAIRGGEAVLEQLKAQAAVGDSGSSVFDFVDNGLPREETFPRLNESLLNLKKPCAIGQSGVELEDDSPNQEQNVLNGGFVGQDGFTNPFLGQHTLSDRTANLKSGRLPNRSEMEQFQGIRGHTSPSEWCFRARNEGSH